MLIGKIELKRKQKEERNNEKNDKGSDKINEIKSDSNDNKMAIIRKEQNRNNNKNKNNKYNSGNANRNTKNTSNDNVGKIIGIDSRNKQEINVIFDCKLLECLAKLAKIRYNKKREDILNDLRVTQAQKLCRLLKIATTGKKSDIIARIMGYISNHKKELKQNGNLNNKGNK